MNIFVLTYHEVEPGHHIDPATFELQIRTFLERFTPVTLDDAVRAVRQELRPERDVFAVTFDDGWANAYRYAYPILKKHGVPATIFVPTMHIGRSSEFLTWDELRAMQPLVAVESHAHTHAYHFSSDRRVGTFGASPRGRERWLTWSGTPTTPGAPVYESSSALISPRYDAEKRQRESRETYERRVVGEFTTSIAAITKETGRRPRYLAWPFGEYTSDAVRIARDAGFEACFTTRIGSAVPGDDPYALVRFAPPRGRYALRMALKGKAGMLVYRAAIAARGALSRFDIRHG